MMMTGKEMATTATHSSQLRGVMTKRVCGRGKEHQRGVPGRKRREDRAHREEGDVEDHEVQRHGKDDGTAEVHVAPGRHGEERLVLGERVEGLRVERGSASASGRSGRRRTLNISMTTRIDKETVVARLDISLTNMSHPI